MTLAVILMGGTTSCIGNNNKNNENHRDGNEHEIIGGKHESETDGIVVITVPGAGPYDIV